MKVINIPTADQKSRYLSPCFIHRLMICQGKGWVWNWLLSTFTSGNASECQGAFKKSVIRGLQQRYLGRLKWEGTSEVQWSLGKGLGEGHQKRESFLVVLVMSKKKSLLWLPLLHSRRAQLYRDPFFKKWDEVSVAFKEGCQDVVTINHAKEAFLHTREMHPRQHMTECSCHALRGVIGPHGANGKVGRRQLLMQSCVCAFIYFLLPVAYSLENSLENALCGEAGAWNY